MLCNLYNKGTCRHDRQSEHVEKGITYQHLLVDYAICCYVDTAGRFHGFKNLKECLWQ